jgi:hypothetical protein
MTYEIRKLTNFIRKKSHLAAGCSSAHCVHNQETNWDHIGPAGVGPIWFYGAGMTAGHPCCICPIFCYQSAAKSC